MIVFKVMIVLFLGEHDIPPVDSVDIENVSPRGKNNKKKYSDAEEN